MLCTGVCFFEKFCHHQRNFWKLYSILCVAWHGLHTYKLFLMPLKAMWIQGRSHEIWSGTVAVGGGSGIEVCSANNSAQSAERNFHLHFWVIRMGSCDTFMLWRLGSIAFKLFEAIDLYSVNCGHVTANWSAGCTADLVWNILAEMWLLPWKVVGLKPDQPNQWLWPWNSWDVAHRLGLNWASWISLLLAVKPGF